jgi:hypothetical protein
MESQLMFFKYGGWCAGDAVMHNHYRPAHIAAVSAERPMLDWAVVPIIYDDSSDAVFVQASDVTKRQPLHYLSDDKSFPTRAKNVLSRTMDMYTFEDVWDRTWFLRSGEPELLFEFRDGNKTRALNLRNLGVKTAQAIALHVERVLGRPLRVFSE